MSAGNTSRFVPWDGGCLFIGAGADVVPVHAHYAIQIAFGSERGVRFRAGEHEEWVEYDGAMVPSRQPHGFDATRVRSWAILFVEPETREGRTLGERYLRGGIAPMPEHALADARAARFAASREQRDDRALADAAWRVIHALTGDAEPSVVADERILRAAAYIRAHLEEPLTLDRVADVACLSPSRFRHLFVAETGMALRPYILWRRFLRVWELLMAGESLSMAAHLAGFADAAHLSRTSRRMFGFPPSAMAMSGARQPIGEAGARTNAER